MQKCYLALGCLWKPEENFRLKPGVISTEVGYAGGTKPKVTYNEVCQGNTGHAETVTIDGFDTSPAASTEYCLQILSSTHDSYPYFCYNSSTASLIVQEIAG